MDSALLLFKSLCLPYTLTPFHICFQSIFFLAQKSRQGAMVHACNISYLGGRNRIVPARTKKLNPISKNKVVMMAIVPAVGEAGLRSAWAKSMRLL
jgi:hypothetical protein